MTKFAVFVFVAIAFVLEEVTARGTDAGVIASPFTDKTPHLWHSPRQYRKQVKATSPQTHTKKNGFKAKDVEDKLRMAAVANAAAKEVARRLYKELTKTTADDVSEAIVRALTDGQKPSPLESEKADVVPAKKRKGARITAKIDAYITDDRPACLPSAILQLFRQPLEDIREQLLEQLQNSSLASTEKSVTDAPESSSIPNTQIEESERDSASASDEEEDLSVTPKPKASEVVKHRGMRKEDISEGDEDEDDDDDDDYGDDDEEDRERAYEENDDEEFLSENGLFRNVNKNILARTRFNLYPPAKIHQIHSAENRHSMSPRRFRYGTT